MDFRNYNSYRVFLLLVTFIPFGYFSLTQTYPLVLVIFNLLTILGGWGYVLWTQMTFKTADLVILCLITLLSFGIFRYRLDEVTPGIWNDEIIVAEVSEQLLENREFKPFTTANYGHPTPLLYLTGLAIHAFGRSVTAIRLVSITLAAVGSGLLFVLLRQGYPRWLAVLGTLIYSTLYPNLVVSRFAYEMSGAMCFLILSLLFTYRYWQKQQTSALVGLGLSLGLGLFTYLGFRTFMIILLIIIGLVIYSKVPRRKQLSALAYVGIPLFVSSQTLISYGLHHPRDLMARAEAVSLFHQNLPPAEVVKELGGNVARTFGMFTHVGDPNPRQNPAGTIPFDYLTIMLSLVGLIALLRHSKYVGLSLLSIALVALINDMLTLERIPEFHYYGLGHPNTLRIFGLIPLMAILVTVGLSQLHQLFLRRNIQVAQLLLVFLTLFVIGINVNRYFNQPVSQYNYYVNGVPALRIAEIVVNEDQKEVALSPSLHADARVQYFAKSSAQLSVFTPTAQIFEAESIPPNTLVILNPHESIEYAKDALSKRGADLTVTIQALVSPWHTIDALIIQRSN